MTPFVPWTLPPAAATGTAAWLRALAQGDRLALDALYRQEAPAVYRYVLALAGDAAAAADATQDAFVALAERPGAFDAGLGTLGAYLAGIARHALLAQWRRRGREIEWDDDSGERAPDEASCPERRLVQQQALQQVWLALRALPWPQREALVLVDLQGRPYAEAARIAGCELNTLRTRVLRARHRLADLLGAGSGDS
ncbi:RNA polymerase sigma factor [Aquincola sp. S2]|uniref:RNA polymerase sigma factor n=1 Tax=Pseudaquabacterium terrae TaxID=2732868 RepID=A0ABX2EM14_9BURK|nr:RNA polymerase sigma factor [Aquabacterium terrae]NRF69694.1 RNA polymerase sigma factor [Aquabacterium terrae]